MGGYEFFRPKVTVPDSLTAKWSSKILEEGFVPFPKKLLRCMRELFAGAEGFAELAVLLGVADYKRPSLSRPPSREYLAFLVNMPVDEFNAVLDRLEKRGFCKVTDHPLGVEVDMEGFFKELEEKTSN
jgi:hypothetical protein